MVALTGYQDFLQIHDGANSQVYRARRASDGQPVILKFLLRSLNRDYPTPEQIRRYKQEYRLICQLDAPGVIKAYSLEQWQRSYAIVLEDFEAISLKQWLGKRKHLSLVDFLTIAIAIVDSLGQIHNQNIIHKDINPTNIVINPKTETLKIIDFGISTQLSRENPPLKSPNILEGTLAYISPEQTGRMNRGLDYRTDFYSLGVMFYEMLTGKLPFDTEDALELVHCHIAQKPSIPNSSCPKAVIDIAMKLMAKNAEDRYQSIDGLKADLEICYQQLKATGTIVSFSLGQKDVFERFQIPQKLYGREREITALLTAFDRVAETGKVEMILVAGYPGIGKSSLVQELHKPITARRGYFISGKFDQLQRNVPYSAIVTAFERLIEQLLGENEIQLQRWRKKLLQALGNNGQIITDIIPSVELIIGKQAAVPVLEANEAQNRFNLVLGNFIRVFCDKEHPLTLFLDDLQWVDLATLKLIERLLREERTQYLLLLGAYRDNEVFASHPLSIALANLQKNQDGAIAEHQDNPITKITLKPLSLDRIAVLINDTLNQISTPNLAQLILQKTGGNPFFVNEFLQELYSEELLKFNRKFRCWQYDIAEIAARDFTENVVELIIGKLQQLPTSSQEILSFAACLGAEFELTKLMWISGKSQQEVFECLKITLNYSFILPLSDPDENLLIQSYKFAHDRIQQAAYALIHDDQKEVTHYAIGKLLLQKIPLEAREENIFDLVSQLNYGTTLISHPKECENLAQLNSIACRKAKETAAYQTGREYANIGLSMLQKDAWQRQYNLCLELHELAAELAFLCGDLEAMEQLIQTVIIKAQSLLDQVNIYQLKIALNTSQNKLTEAIAIAQQFLQQLGINFPKKTTEDDIQQAVSEINQLMGEREVEDLINLPMMTDREKIAIVEIIDSIIITTYIADPPLFPLVVGLSVKLSIQYGNTAASAFAYDNYGIVACNLLQDVDTGVKFGQLALQVVAKLAAKVVKAKVLISIGFLLLHRKSHTKETLPLQQEGYASALEVGNLAFVGWAAHNFCFNAFWCGQPLISLEQEARTYCDALSRLHQLTTANYCRIYWQTILNLMGAAEYPTLLSGEALQETEFLSQLLSASDLLGLYIFHLYKLVLCYLLEEMEMAQNQIVEVKRYLLAGTGTVGMPAFYFYDSLVALAALNSPSADTLAVLQQVEQNQICLQQQWARYAPMNHQHKVDLVAAEQCRVLGQKAEAIELYNKAISGAKANNYIQEEALANELAAKFYLGWGNQEKVARVYMMDAHYCYSCWGATAKVKHLEERYPHLCSASIPQTVPRTLKNTHTTSDSTDGAVLDFAAVMKSANAISSEIVLDRLLENLMRIAIANAGAQKGFLLLPDQDTAKTFVIEAEGTIESETVKVLQSIPIDIFDPNTQLPRLSTTIVNYVSRTQESVVLNNAARKGQFARDSYITAVQPKSILCIPLLNQGILNGILYLENKLTTGAFTAGRIEVLKLLSSQAAISIENSRLYRTLEQKVAERTKELSQTLDILKATQAELAFENALLRSDEQTQAYDYQVGGSLPLDAPTYVVRSADRYLYKALQQSKLCYILSARQMGKSSLMVRMMHHLQQEGHLCAVLDMTRIGSDDVTPEQWYKGLAVELWQALELMDRIRLSSWWKDWQDLSTVQRLGQFVEVVLRLLWEDLEQQDRQLIIFLDEIDHVLSLNFAADDFFALLRAIYNQRAVNPIYKRLTFALFGVATPADLIADRRRTPFNLGQSIELNGFQSHEAQTLSQGLSEKVENPQIILSEILAWTGGQPFLTQKLCQIVRSTTEIIPNNAEAAWVETLVRTCILEQWESQDEPQHLRTIRDRILESERSSQLLRLYQQILNQGKVTVTDRPEERELLLSGIVVKQSGQLQVYNRIYQSIFNPAWVETCLGQ